MKFRTIWSIPAMSFSNRLLRTRDWAAMEIAAHLPKRIRYWVTILEMGKATMTSENVPATPLSDVLQNLDAPNYVS